MTDSAEKMREAIKRFHRNGCYPEALDFEVDALVNELAALSASGTKSDGGVESRHAKTGNMSGAVPEEEQSLPASGFVRAFGPEDKTSKPRDGVAPIPSDPIPSQPDERESIARLLTAAKLLQQNAIGCATNHHGHDCELNGLPGWLADTKKDIDAAEAAILAMQAERRADNTVQRDRIYRAAERSNTRFGQWMPERWVNIFVEELNK